MQIPFFLLLVDILTVRFFCLVRFLSFYLCLLLATRGGSFSCCSTTSWYNLGSLLQLGEGRCKLSSSRLTIVTGGLRHILFLGDFCSIHLLVPFVTSVAIPNPEWSAMQKPVFFSISCCSCYSLLHLIVLQHVPHDNGRLHSTSNGTAKVLLLDC